MENISIDMTINLDLIIGAVSLIISVVGGIYAAITSTKKYELTEKFRAELLGWYAETVSIMIEFIHYIQNSPVNEEFVQRKNELLCRLSAQIEVGRFYFPNINKGDSFGDHKPAAYQGYRHINLEFLIHFYQIGSQSNCEDYVDSLWKMERYFTSEIYKMIDPVKRNKCYSKYTELVMPKGMTMEDFVRENPKKTRIFW